MNVIKENVGESISTITIVAPLVAIMNNETKLKRFGITAATAIGWGQEEGMDEETAMWKEGVRVRSFTSMEAQKGKKILFERLFSRNKNRGQEKSLLNYIWNKILSETNRRK